jgi:hypothetical protein
VTIHQEDFENAIGLNLDKKEELLICKKYGTIMLFDSATYLVKSNLDLNLEKSDSREPLQILSVNKSHDDSVIAVFVGKQMIKDLEMIMYLYILKQDRDKYVIHK